MKKLFMVFCLLGSMLLFSNNRTIPKNENSVSKIESSNPVWHVCVNSRCYYCGYNSWGAFVEVPKAYNCPCCGIGTGTGMYEVLGIYYSLSPCAN